MHVYSTYVDRRATTVEELDAKALAIVAAVTKEIHARERAMESALVRKLETDAGTALTQHGPCAFASETGRVRKMQVSREREDACLLVHDIARADAKDDAAELVALLVLRDRANMARWVTAPDKSRPQHPFLSTVSMTDARKLERWALAHPASVLGALGAADILAATTTSTTTTTFDPIRARAAQWDALGDAPLDVVASHVR